MSTAAPSANCARVTFEPGCGVLAGGSQSAGSGAFRALRVLRPLRTIRRLRGLRIIVNTLLKSLPDLLNVMVLLAFLFTVFAILGLQLFYGVLRNTCVRDSDGALLSNVSGSTTGMYCSPEAQPPPGAIACPAGFSCLPQGTNPAAGLFSFDDIGHALLTQYHVVDTTGWSPTMWAVQDAAGSAAWVYFVAIILVVSFFAMNLVLAVVVAEFESTSDDAEAEEMERFAEEEMLYQLQQAARRERSRKSVAGGSSPTLDLEAQVPVEAKADAGPVPLPLPSPVLQAGRMSRAVSMHMPEEEVDAVLALPPVKENQRRRSILAKRRISMMFQAANSSKKSLTKALADSSSEEPDEGLEQPEAPAALPAGDAIESKDAGGAAPPSPPLRAAISAASKQFDSADPQAAVTVARLVLNGVDLEVHRDYEWLEGKPWWLQRVHAVVTSVPFFSAVAGLILANTVILAMEYHGMSPTYAAVLEAFNNTFTALFTVELVLKVLALGPAGYVRDTFNVFDAIIVIISLVELAVASSAGNGLSAFRVFRLLRIGRLLKLLRSFKGLRRLLNTVLESLVDILYISILMFLFVLVFAVLGVQLFAGQFHALNPRPEYTFETFGSAFLAVFQLLTTDNWHSMLRDSVLATGSEAASVYLVVGHAIGAYIVLSLFVAILLRRFSSFDADELDTSELEHLAFERRTQEAKAALEAAKDELPVVPELQLDSGEQLVADMVQQLSKLRQQREAEKQQLREQQSADLSGRMVGTALGCLPPTNPARQWLFAVVSSEPFELGVVCLILLSCVFLALDDPTVPQASLLGRTIAIMDVVFAVVFAVESLLKIIAHGLFTPEGGYLRNGWNRLDFVVVLFGLLSFAAPGLTIVRALRALRPLRVAVRSESIRVVVNALLYAIPNVANVFALAGVSWLIFAIMAVNLVGGALFQCSDPSVTSEAACNGMWNSTTGVQPREWERVPGSEYANYDNVGISMLTLFRISTFSGWAGLMKMAMDTVGPGQAPRPGANPGMAIFFLAFVICCAFFVLNLTVAVVIDQFNQLRSVLDGSAFMTQRQRQWVNAQRLISSVELVPKPRPPSNCVRAAAFAAVSHPAFEACVIGCILANTGLLMCAHWGQPAWLPDFVLWGNVFFAIVFALEAVAKLLGLGPEVYWRDSWNRFDLLLVLLSFVGLALEGDTSASAVRIFRLFRVARLFRLIKRAETLRRAFATLMLSLPSLWNIGAMLIVGFFVFAVMGVQLFGHIIPADDIAASAINRRQNFRTFGDSLQTVWIVTTGDSWEGPMYVAMENTSDVAAIFFVGIQIVISFTMLQLFIAVVLENFADSEEDEETAAQRHGIAAWAAVWNSFDRLASRLLRASLLPRLMMAAPAPFGFGGNLASGKVLRRLKRLAVPAFMAPEALVRNQPKASGLWHVETLILARKRKAQSRQRRRADTVSAAPGQSRGGEAAANPMATGSPSPHDRVQSDGGAGGQRSLVALRNMQADLEAEAQPGSSACPCTDTAWRARCCGTSLNDEGNREAAICSVEWRRQKWEEWGFDSIAACCCPPTVGGDVDVQFDESHMPGHSAQAGEGKATLVISASPRRMKSVSGGTPGAKPVWVLQFGVTLKALASVVLGLDVQVISPNSSRRNFVRAASQAELGSRKSLHITEENMGEYMVMAHELFAVAMIEGFWQHVQAKAAMAARKARTEAIAAADARVRAALARSGRRRPPPPPPRPPAPPSGQSCK